MGVKSVVFVCSLQFILLLLVEGVRLHEFNERRNRGTIDNNSDRGCAYLHCEGNGVCIHRKFRCKEPPCPSMLYCAKSQTESSKGPSSCDTVQCTVGYVCMLKVRRCHWDNKCEQQIARCVSRKEYFEGPASCAGFKCPQGSHCILRESLCANPPCKLLRSCAKNKEVHIWFGRCRSLGCPSEYECFLRRPENNCTNPPCQHTPDCITTREHEVTNEHCVGWICPRTQTCFAEIAEFCDSDVCDVKRTCLDIIVLATNNSSSYFSRRSLSNEDKVHRNNTKTTGFHGSEVEGSKTPHLLLDHLNSKTELDAIELWINNAEGQDDFQQFQDWLRPIKDILGPSAYNSWLEENLSSRGETFQKWLQASHDKLDAENPIFPRQERPSTSTKNPYPARDTMNIASPHDSDEEGRIFTSLPRKENLTNTIEKLVIPNRITESPYSTFDTALLDNLRQSNPFLNFLLNDPSHGEDQFSTTPKVENTSEPSHPEDSMKNIRELSNSSIVHYNSGLQNLSEIISRNKTVSHERTDSPSFEWNKLPSSNDATSPLWPALHENPIKELSLTETNFGEDSTLLSEDQKLIDEEQFFNDVPLDLLEKLVKSLHFSAIENLAQDFDGQYIEQHHQDSPAEISQNEPDKQNFRWSLVKQPQDKEDTSRNLNSHENVNQFVSHNSDDKKVRNDFEERIGILLDKLVFSDSDHSDNINLELPLHQPIDHDKDAMDLNLLLQQNKESILPYIQTRMEIINEQNVPSSFQDSEPNQGESSVKNYILSNAQFGSADEFPNELSSARVEPPNTFIEKPAHNPNCAQDSHFLEDQTSDSNFPNQDKIKQGLSNLELQQDILEKNSRMSGPIYAFDEPTVRTFYNLPSYGASDGGAIAVQDIIYGEHNLRKSKESDQ